MTLRSVGVRLTAEIGSYQSNLRKAAQATKDFKGELDKASKKGNLDKLSNAVGGLGLGLAGLAAAGVKMSMDFDKAMSAVSAATHAPRDQLEKLRQAAIAAGKDTQYSATQAADGVTELAKAGVSTANILGGGLKGALSLAAAGQLDVGEAAETAASAMTQFKLSGDQIPHLADLLAAAAGKAQGSVHDVGQALNQSGLVAAQFGLSIEDTTGALAEFASAGLVGSDAGTSFKTMLLAMANPSKITKSMMDELGISFYNAQGKFIGLDGVAEMLRTRLKGLTQEQRNSALAQIFGNDAIRSASILYTDGAQGVQKWKSAVNDSGYAADTAAKLTDNLAGDLERLKGSLETVAIQSGGGATDGLRALTKGANGAVNVFSGLPHWIQETVTVLSGVGGVGLIAAAGFIKMRSTGKELLDELRDMGPKGEAAARGLGKVGSVAGKLGLVGVAATAVYTGVKLFTGWVDGHFAATTRDVDAMTDSLAKFAATGQATGELGKTFGANMAGLSRDLDDLRKAQTELQKINQIASGPAGNIGRDRAKAALGGQIKDATAQAKEDIASLDQALANLVTNGNATAAKTAFDDFARAAGLTLDKLPKYSAAAQGAELANTGLARGFGSVKANATTMAKSLDEAITAGQKLSDVWDQLHGAILSTDKANLDAAQAVDAVKESFKSNKKAIDGNSEAALKNRIAIGSAAEAAAKAAEAKYEETGSVTAASKTYDRYIAQLRKTLSQSGLTKAEVDKLIKAYATMPPSVATKVTAPGAKAAKTQLDEAKAAADKLAGLYNVALKVTGQDKVEAAFRKLSGQQQALKSGRTLSLHGHDGYATGGYTGPGGKHEPAGIVHRDEYVIKSESRKKIEASRPGLLDSMNAGHVPGYAGGGHVLPFPVTAAMTKIPTEAQALSKLLGSAGGGNLGAWIMAAISLTGVGAGWAGPLRTLIMRESGGNPRSINLWDSNAQAGHPSKGLMQTIPSTFAAYRLKSLPDDIYNPVANIVAGIRYIESRYGSIFNVQQANPHRPPKGYANGGMITEPISGVGASGRRYTFGEAGPEYVTPMWQAGSHGGGGGGTEVHIHFSGPVGSQHELKQWLTGAFDDLRRTSRV
jgi:TP901 family phage tail tape measure protein